MVCGHREYWPQFPDLKAELLAVAHDCETLIGKQGIEIINYANSSGDSMVDNPEDGYRAGFVRDWAQSGINHHFSLSVGHNASVIKKLATALHIPFKQIR